jgi:hypothetical protein
MNPKGPTEMFFEILGTAANTARDVVLRREDRKDRKAGLSGDRELQASTGLSLGSYGPAILGGVIALGVFVVLALLLKR